MIEWVAQGRYAIHFGAGENMVPELQERGVKFGIVTDFKKYGGLITAGAGSIIRLSNPAHPNAQIVFINWLLSKEARRPGAKQQNSIVDGWTYRRPMFLRTRSPNRASNISVRMRSKTSLELRKRKLL